MRIICAHSWRRQPGCLATVRDMGSGGANAVAPLREKGITDLICHYYFLAAVGKKLFEQPYGLLRRLLKSNRVRTDLRDRRTYSTTTPTRGGSAWVWYAKSCWPWCCGFSRATAPRTWSMKMVSSTSEKALPGSDIGLNAMIEMAYLWVMCALSLPKIRALFIDFKTLRPSTARISRIMIPLTTIL